MELYFKEMMIFFFPDIAREIAWDRGYQFLDKELQQVLDDLLDQTNPFAIITAAHLKTKATKDNPQERYSWKWTITKALYEKGFSTKNILNLYRLVDWLMMLPDNLTKHFTQNLIAYEEEKKMPYVTSAERIGIEKAGTKASS